MTDRKGRSHAARGRAAPAAAERPRRAPDPPGPALPEPREAREGRAGDAREHVEDLLDEALMQTFPASDPITLKACGNGDEGASAGADPVPRGTGPNDGHAGEPLPAQRHSGGGPPAPVAGGH
ncbi:MAG: hypothetical protein MUF07_06070 [Steroidobacteraceae bacterium]|nr:hypothetical protein [Steroidobacteraceae bacterium]